MLLFFDLEAKRMKGKKKYTEDDMEQALKAIKAGLTLGKASKQFNIPKMTLSDRVRGKYQTSTVGRPTELSSDEEMVLIYYIKYMASIAHPLTPSQIKVFAWNIAKRKGNTRFNATTGPGHTWWDKFRKRHSQDLTLRKPDNLDRGRSRMANANVMNQHFDLLRETLEKLQIKDKPDRIFNCDESGISMNVKTGKVCF